MDTCVTYFNLTTQFDVPEREIGKYSNGSTQQNSQFTSQSSWVTSSTTNEYNCMGINIVPIPGVTGAEAVSYMTLQEWSDVWAQGGCIDLFKSMILGKTTAQQTAAFSVNNFYLVQDDFNFMFSRFFNNDIGTQYGGNTGPCLLGATGVTTGLQTAGKVSNADNNCNVWIGGKYSLVIPNQSGSTGAYNEFMETLLDACTELPGACAQMQQYMCSECSRSEIVANPTLIRFCGCLSATNSGGNQFYNSSLPNYDPACDPICNRDDTIKLIDTTTGIADVCNASVCIIDTVTINSISSTGVQPTFNQVCPACANGQGNCICIIDATFDSTIPSIKGNDGGAIDNNIKFTQYCPNSQCFVSDPATGFFVEVACADKLPKGTGPKAKVPLWVIITCIAVIIFAFIVIMAYKYTSDNTRVFLKEKRYEYTEAELRPAPSFMPYQPWPVKPMYIG